MIGQLALVGHGLASPEMGTAFELGFVRTLLTPM